MKKYFFLTILILSIAGALDSAYLTYEHFSNSIPFCSTHFPFLDCGKVLKSQYSQIYGIPLALLGLIHYLILAVIIFITIISANKFFKYILLVQMTIGALVSVYLMYIQIFLIGSICLYCTLSALISTALFLLIQRKLSLERKELFILFHGFIYQKILKPVLFLINAEIIHETITTIGEIMGEISPAKWLIQYLMKTENTILRQKIVGINFPSPIGLSAGFDYEAKLTRILPSLGFGFGTVGTITNLPYEGNPLPRLGRLPKSRSLMVNKGFKNMGAQKIIEKLGKYNFDIPIGVSIGRTNSRKLSTINESIADIISAFSLFEKSSVKHTYYELNISCPNLYGSISFYPPRNLELLLKALAKINIKRPVFVKMPIEKSNREVLSMLEIINRFKFIKGVIFGNLQKNRKDPSLCQEEVRKFPVGNFSGKPCEKRSNELIKLCYKKYGKRLIIIGCGGVFSAEDAYKKIKLGASLVQLITGMVYQGPQLIPQINIELIELLKKDGLHNLSDTIGKV